MSFSFLLIAPELKLDERSGPEDLATFQQGKNQTQSSLIQ